MDAFVKSISQVIGNERLDINAEFRNSAWTDHIEQSLRDVLRDKWNVAVSDEAFTLFKSVKDLWREAFLVFAARLFEVPRESIDGSTSIGSIPQWDSVNHLRLVMECEARFEVSYPLEKIITLKKLEDFLPAV